MSEVGNKYLGTFKNFTCLTFVYKDTEDFGEPWEMGAGCGTVIEISKITPKQVVAKFYRYKDNDYNTRREETTQPGCRYMVWEVGGWRPCILLKKSAAMWDNPSLKRLTIGFNPFFLDEEYLQKMEGGEPLVEEEEEEEEEEVELDYLLQYNIHKGYILDLLARSQLLVGGDESSIDKKIIVKLSTQIHNLQP